MRFFLSLLCLLVLLKVFSLRLSSVKVVARERERVDSSTSVVFLTLSLFLSRRGLCSGERKKKEKLEELGQKKKSSRFFPRFFWPMKSCFSLFFSLFSFSPPCGAHHKHVRVFRLRPFLRASSSSSREKESTHTQQQQSTTTQTKDRKKCERSSSAEFKNQFV